MLIEIDDAGLRLLAATPAEDPNVAEAVRAWVYGSPEGASYRLGLLGRMLLDRGLWNPTPGYPATYSKPTGGE